MTRSDAWAAPAAANQSTSRFRPDLEGLRAVAVILVLLYHANVPGFGGGFIGVDVFFVLSGFLITGLIYRELSSTGRLSLANFYARRARRLLPAAGVVLIVTLIAALIILPAFRMSDVQKDIASAGLYISNLRFGFQANDYFQAGADPSPVLHFWSLSVEEQFYILWPAILVGLYAGTPGSTSPGSRVAIGIFGIGIVSIIGSVWLTGADQPWAFYLLPTRAWELAVGGLIAVGLVRLGGIPRRLAAGATVVGLASVIGAALLFDDSTPFPGLSATLPVAGAALVILGGLPNDAPLPSRLLALRPFRFLGRISYSVYLWHWPIILFGGVLLGPDFAFPLALLAIPVGAASQRWIEEPLRYGRFIGTIPRRNLLQAAGVGLAVVIATSAASGFPGPGTGLATNSEESESPTVASTPASGEISPSPDDIGPQPCSGCTVADLTPPLADLLTGRIPDGGCDVMDASDCVLGTASPGAPVVALFGDSHAGNWTVVIAQLATTHGWRFVHLTHPGCASVLTPIWNARLKRVDAECDQWREQAIRRLEAERPNLTMVTNGEHYPLVDPSGSRIAFTNPPTAAWVDLWSAGLDKMLDRVTGASDAVVLMGDGPVPRWSGLDPPACIAKQGADFRACRASRTDAVQPDVYGLDRAAAASHGATFLDPSPWFCDTATCPAVIDRHVVYVDGNGHLTASFVLSLADRIYAAMPFPR